MSGSPERVARANSVWLWTRNCLRLLRPVSGSVAARISRFSIRRLQLRGHVLGEGLGLSQLPHHLLLAEHPREGACRVERADDAVAQDGEADARRRSARATTCGSTACRARRPPSLSEGGERDGVDEHDRRRDPAEPHQSDADQVHGDRGELDADAERLERDKALQGDPRHGGVEHDEPARATPPRSERSRADRPGDGAGRRREARPAGTAPSRGRETGPKSKNSGMWWPLKRVEHSMREIDQREADEGQREPPQHRLAGRRVAAPRHVAHEGALQERGARWPPRETRARRRAASGPGTRTGRR